jgi:ubiquinone/menaquinone biosynthesis C-methylase UbiE
MDPAHLFAEPLVDLGADDPAFAGILTPASARGAEKHGVTAQFLEQAGEYHRRYLDVGYWAHLIDRALAVIGAFPPPRTVIDIGSGSGNSVLPLADRFPEAEILATDISPQLLAILRDFVAGRPDAQRFGLVCADAAAVRYRPGVADLAVGAAILHHIFDPARLLASCHEALRPGGWAMFFEPFEAGNQILKLTYQRVLAQASADEHATPGMQLVSRMVEDYVARSRPRTDPIFERIDDKWMFTRAYFERVGREQGWAEVKTYGLNIGPTPLRVQATVHLRLGAELPPGALPEWAWGVIDETDAGLSMDLKEEWATEGAVLLRKAA